MYTIFGTGSTLYFDNATENVCNFFGKEVLAPLSSDTNFKITPTTNDNYRIKAKHRETDPNAKFIDVTLLFNHTEQNVAQLKINNQEVRENDPSAGIVTNSSKKCVVPDTQATVPYYVAIVDVTSDFNATQQTGQTIAIVIAVVICIFLFGILKRVFRRRSNTI